MAGLKPGTPEDPASVQFAARASRIVLAYIAASSAAGFIISVYGLIASMDFGFERLAVTLMLSVFYAGMVAIMAAVPALILIAAAEYFGWRHKVLHLVLGGATGFGLYALTDAETGPDPLSAIAFALAGLAAGYVYWTIAARKFTAASAPAPPPPPQKPRQWTGWRR